MPREREAGLLRVPRAVPPVGAASLGGWGAGRASVLSSLPAERGVVGFGLRCV